MDKKQILQRLSGQAGHIGFYCENMITGERFGCNEELRRKKIPLRKKQRSAIHIVKKNRYSRLSLKP